MKRQDPPARVLIGAKVTPEFAAEIREIAALEDRPVSSVIRRSLVEYAALRRADIEERGAVR